MGLFYTTLEEFTPALIELHEFSVSPLLQRTCLNCVSSLFLSLLVREKLAFQVLVSMAAGENLLLKVSEEFAL